MGPNGCDDWKVYIIGNGCSPQWGHGLVKQIIATKLQQLPQNALSTKSRLQAFQLTMAGDRRWKAWLKWQGIAKSPQNHLMSTKASFAWLACRIHSNFWQSDFKRAMSYGSCVFPFGGSSLGHTGSWNRWWEFGTCQAPDRFLQFTDSNSMRNGSDFRGVGLQNGANAERIQASDVISNLWMCIMHVCVMLKPKRKKQYNDIFRYVEGNHRGCWQMSTAWTDVHWYRSNSSQGH